MAARGRDYRPVEADAALEEDCRQLVRLAVREDLERSFDWTTVALVDAARRGCCDVVPRVAGIAAGLVTIPWIVDEMDADLSVELRGEDGQAMVPGEALARLRGNARDLLTCERVILNVLCRLCGVATLTKRFAAALAEHSARLYDTRKTTPGWRRLEKYAVRCGGGRNHRTGLFDGFLIKDNHLALGGEAGAGLSPRRAVDLATRFAGGRAEMVEAPEIVEIEVDSLEQFAELLDGVVLPQIVLLDNFSNESLRRAVQMRDQRAADLELEASGNVRLETIAAIAATGVDRISCGALTHQATWLDLGMDWHDEAVS